MTVAIVATEANLRTLNVTIQSLTVNGKQLTLAVFRQFPIIKLANDNGTIRNLKFWGRVSYSIKNEGDNCAVVEQDGLLFRGLVPDYISHYIYDSYAIERAKLNAGAYYSDDTKRIAAQKRYTQMLQENEDWVNIRRPNFLATKEFLLNLPQLFIAV